MCDQEQGLEQFCKDLPKVELHAHLNGSVPLEFLLKLAEEQKIKVESEAFFLRAGDERSLAQCFELFDLVYQLTHEDTTIYRVTKTVIQSFCDENVKYLELRTTPKENPQTNRTKESYIKSVLSAINECNEDESMDIITRLIISIDRKKSM